MNIKFQKIIGWGITLLLAVFFSISAFSKINQSPSTIAQAEAIGLNANTYLVIGIIELCSLLLFIFPRTGVIGSMLLIAYMGGAIVTHLEHQDSITMSLYVQILLWISAFLRFPELRSRMLLGTTCANP